jgi:hypothetical protein
MIAFLYNKIQSTILIFTTLIILSGCEKIQLGEPYDCKIGTKYLIDNNLVFSIDSIRDYRCPKDVICIWGGDVDLYFNININLTKIDTLIRLYRNNPIETGDYTWKVLEVDPLLKADQTIDQKDYKIKLLVQKN